jgi:putative hydrolase of the HAD superfamily
MKKVLILDLDNTIYPAPSIAPKLFEPVYQMINESSELKPDAEQIKKDMMKIPFQKVAESYHFPEQLKSEIIEKLRQLKYEGEIKPFEDFEFVKDLNARKFLVTTGFTNMQQSKIDLLNLDDIFDEIYIVDPEITPNKTKGDAFIEIIQKHKFATDDILVVGDDEDSEIKFAKQLRLAALVYDRQSQGPDRISDFSSLLQYFH